MARKRKNLWNSRSRLARRRARGCFFSAFLPLILLAFVLFCLGFLVMMGYKILTASSFFSVRDIQIQGVKQISRDEIERIVRAELVGSNVWNADIQTIRQIVERNPMVKTAVVSRKLPDTIRIQIVEREPLIIAKINDEFFWVDDEVKILRRATESEMRGDPILTGLEENDSERNKQRIKLAMTMLSEFRQTEIWNRLKMLNLSNLQEPKVFVEDSGELVSVVLGKEDFGKSLQKALEILEGRGKEIESVISQGGHPIVRFKKI